MNFIRRLFNSQKTLAASATPAKKRHLPYTDKAVSRVRQDIKSWNTALQSAQTEEPKNFAIQLLYNEIMLDAHLSSQIENRKQQTLSAQFALKNKTNNELDEEQTKLLQNMAAYRTLNSYLVDMICYGYSLVELELVNGTDGEQKLNVILIPRTNVVPKTGKFYPDYAEDKAIDYREMPEYGTWILEFDTTTLGLLNKAVSHVLFKRFAQSCWSELCEIYGIPPRVMKTNTQDTVLLNRAEQMMKDMGAAAWFIIDETESFEWAKGTDTNGDVYANLIKLCSNEISLLINGAVIGQDTKHGNESKEESSQNMLWGLVQSDMAMIEGYWNNTIIPALVKIGILKGDVYFEFSQAEDTAQLWTMTKEALPFYNVDPKWVKDKFGIEITSERLTASQQGNGTLGIGEDFFV